MNQISRYEILSQLGGGGMAVVYRAYDPRFKREVAIKVMAPHFLHDPQFRQRFEREAQLIASLQHPAIVPVYDFGSENGQPYLVMALMSGGSLIERLQHGPLSLEETARLLERLAPALDMAHQKGIIHRDLKPDNILFDEQGNPYIADFGIAKLVAQTTMGLTQTGMVIGTPFYMSPEQARGEKDIDGRSDIYSLAAILFELMTGQRPYEADTPAGFIYKHIYEPIPSIYNLRPDLPRSCETVITLAMAKDRERRYATVQQFAAAWKAVVEKGHISNDYSLPDVTGGSEATFKSDEGRTTVLIAPSWRQRWSLASLAALLVIVIGAVILLRMVGQDGVSTFSYNNSNSNDNGNRNSIVLETTNTTSATSLPLLTNSPTSVPEDTPVPSKTPKPLPTKSPTIKPSRTPKPSPTVEPSPTVVSTEQLILGDWLQEADGGASVFRFAKGGAFVGCTRFSGGKSLSNGSWDVQGDIVHTKFTFKVFSKFGVDDDGRKYDWYYEFIDENTIAPTVNRKLLLIRVDDGIYEACMES